MVAELPVLVSNALGGSSKLIQVADLMSTRKCTRLPDYPLPVYNAAGSSVKGFPVICGGQRYKKRVSVRACFIHERTPYSRWRLLAELKHPRSRHASVELHGRLWVTGGKNEKDGRLFSTEFISRNGKVKPGPDLPHEMDDHCMVKLRDGRVMILGGHPDRRSVMIFNPYDGSFVDGPDMLFDRYSSACAVFNSPMHDERPVVMVIGNKNFAEIWDYTKSGTTWEKSNYLLHLSNQLYTRVLHDNHLCHLNLFRGS